MAKNNSHIFEVPQNWTFLILSDVNMSGMNGLLVRDEINKDEYLRRKAIPFKIEYDDVKKSPNDVVRYFYAD